MYGTHSLAGQLLKYDVSEEGIWDVTAEVQIAIEVLKDDKVIGNQKVVIEENDKSAFVAKISNGE